MTQETRFSRIAVTADDDDDFVIEAGVVASSEPAANPAFAFAEPLAEPASGLRSEPEPAPVVIPAPEPAASAAPESAGPERKPAAKAADAYETTLEDLEGASMSGVQKAIIAVAILAVAAFVAYLLLV